MAFIILVTLAIPLVVMRTRIEPTAQRKLVDLVVFKEASYLLFAIGEFFTFMGLYIPFFYVQLYSIQGNIVDVNLGFYLLSIMNAGSFFGRIMSAQSHSFP